MFNRPTPTGRAVIFMSLNYCILLFFTALIVVSFANTSNAIKNNRTKGVILKVVAVAV